MLKKNIYFILINFEKKKFFNKKYLLDSILK